MSEFKRPHRVFAAADRPAARDPASREGAPLRLDPVIVLVTIVLSVSLTRWVSAYLAVTPLIVMILSWQRRAIVTLLVCGTVVALAAVTIYQAALTLPTGSSRTDLVGLALATLACVASALVMGRVRRGPYGPMEKERLSLSLGHDETAERLRAIVQYSPLAIYAFDRNGEITLWNPAAEQLFGWTEAETVGRPVPFLTDHQRPEFDFKLRRLLAGEQITNLELTRVCADGREIPVTISSGPLYDASGSILGALSIATDISQRRHDEMVLTSYQRQLDALISNLPGMVYSRQADAEHAIDFVSAGCLPLTGYTRDELEHGLITSYEQLIHPDDRQRFRTNTERALESRTPWECEYRLVDRNGEVRWVWEHAAGIYEDSGTLSSIYGFVQDISERKAAEAAVAGRLLLEERQSRILNNAPGAIYAFLLRPDGTAAMPYASPNIANLFGIDADTISNSPDAMWAAIHPDDGTALKSAIAQSARALTPWEFEFRVAHPIKGEVWIQGRSSPELTDDGTIVWHGFFNDITDRKTTERSLKLFRALMDNINDAIDVIDPLTGRFLDVNERACLDRGYSRDELLSMKVSDIDGNSSSEGSAQNLRHLKEHTTLMLESVYIRRDGTLFPVEINASLVRVDDRSFVVSVVRDISDRKAQEDRIRHLAFHDVVTGLPNRALLMDRLQLEMAHAQRDGRELGVVIIDLDHFKKVNDTLGHPVGDELLKGVADRLVASLRESDTVSRLGGDEFVVLLPNLTHEAAIKHCATKILDLFNTSFVVGEHDLHASCSVGFAVYPRDGTNSDALLRHADLALYQAKRDGRGTCRFFDIDMDTVAQRRLWLERGLHRALVNRELVIHYQPQLELESGKIVGVEALLRWTLDGQNVRPDEFIPVAEETGLIVPIGDWVLRETCLQAARWYQEHGIDIRMAVNLSPRQLRDGNLCALVEEVLTQTGLRPDRLEVEITESSVMENLEYCAGQLARLRALGVQLAMDDFGTGYSSLAYLKRLPLNRVKIDRAFVRDLDRDGEDAALVQLIIAMASQLGLSVIAEGVETQQQLELLHDWGCGEIQGYFLGRPMDAESVLEFMINYRRDSGQFASKQLTSQRDGPVKQLQQDVPGFESAA